nr:smoothelin-like [Parasteatoda tepidariorum]
MAEVVNGVALMSLTSEESLYKLLDDTEDYDERKKVRNRLRQVQAELRAQREEAMKKREQEREDMILQRKRDAEESKRRMLAMYDQMAKSAPAGGQKVMDINIYKNAEPSSTPVQMPAKRDLVEEAIQQRQKEAIERRQKLLAAYDAAAKSGVPGPKSPDFNAINESTSAPVTPVAKKPVDHCTFGSIIPKTPVQNNQKVSAKAKFQQMDAVQNKQAPSRPKYMCTLGGTKSNVEITNFSTSWNDGMAFCALIHHFYPDAFEFETLNPKNRRYNFDLAFRIAEEKADIAPLLDVEDMVIMKKPDWKCVFTYVQSFYRKLHDKD